MQTQVVLYRFSTSNHNEVTSEPKQGKLYYIVSLHQTTTLWLKKVLAVLLHYIVSLHQTTTPRHLCCASGWLYYIVSLHQTTTENQSSCIVFWLYYIVSLHQTTTRTNFRYFVFRCIISFLYIKPQPVFTHVRYFLVVLYRFSTSNHNREILRHFSIKLYYIVSLHQTTTIAPYTPYKLSLYYIVSLHQTTTIQKIIV